jgi:hypothetical protein
MNVGQRFWWQIEEIEKAGWSLEIIIHGRHKGVTITTPEGQFYGDQGSIAESMDEAMANARAGNEVAS